MSKALECIKELYKERAYAYDDKVMHKGNGWSDAIQHYDNIGKCLDTIKQVLIKLQKQEEILIILKESPFILESIFNNKGLKNQNEYDKKYFWGTISKENVKKVEKWLEDDIK